MTDDERVEFGRAVFEAGGPLTNYADSYSTQRLVKIHEALSDGTIPVRSKKAETALQKKHSDGKWAVSMRDQGRRRLLEPLKILGIRNAGPEHYNDNELLNLIERKVGTGGVYSLWRAADDWAADPPDSAVGEEAEAVMRGEIAGAQPSVDRIKLVSMDGESLRRKFIRSVIDHYAHLVREYGPTAEKYERFLEREKKRQEAAPRKRLTARQREKLDDEIAKLTLSRRNKGADRYVSEAWAEATALYWGPRNDEYAGKIQGYNWEVWRRMRPAYEKIMTRLRQDGYRAKGDSRPSLAPVVSTGWQPATKPLKASGKGLEPASDAEFAGLLQDLRSLASQKTIRTGRSSWSVYLPEAVVQVPDAANEAEAEAEAERMLAPKTRNAKNRIAGLRARIAALRAGGGEWNEADHPRGQPGNVGQFAEKQGGGGAAQRETTAARAKRLEGDLDWRRGLGDEAATAVEYAAEIREMLPRALGIDANDDDDDEFPAAQIDDWLEDRGVDNPSIIRLLETPEYAGPHSDVLDSIPAMLDALAGLDDGDGAPAAGDPDAADDVARAAYNLRNVPRHLNHAIEKRWKDAPVFYRGTTPRNILRPDPSHGRPFVSLSVSENVAASFVKSKPGSIIVAYDGDSVRDLGRPVRYSLAHGQREYGSADDADLGHLPVQFAADAEIRLPIRRAAEAAISHIVAVGRIDDADRRSLERIAPVVDADPDEYDIEDNTV